jgi:aldose 1-epimerase
MQQMIANVTLLAAGLSVALLSGCASTGGSSCCGSTSEGSIMKEPFGKTSDGQAVDIYTLRGTNGMEARIMTYGGTLVSLKVPDKSGNFGDVVLGCDSVDAYQKQSGYLGALIGRYGNRIAKGQFTLDGKTYQLDINNPPNSLHGGTNGYDKVIWTAKPVTTDSGPSLELTYVSKDGEEGYPGKLKIKAVYKLTDDNSLRIEFTATTDKDTVVNLTGHSYWNLAGKSNILDHVVMINADKFTPIDEGLIPTGVLQPVDGTPFDFRTPTAVGARIEQVNEQIKFGKGYDHNWVLNKEPGKLDVAASLYEPTTGRMMQVLTTEPGIQFYSGNFLDGTITGKGGWVYQFRNGLCFEPQHFPDSPNQPAFPSTELKPGETYHNIIEYKFSTK